jgi:hypothetical protein
VAFEVPEDGRHQYHVLRLSVQILAANRSLLSLDGSLAYERTFVDKPDPSYSYDSKYSVMEWNIQQVSRIRELTRGSQSVTVIEHLQIRNGQDSVFGGMCG